MLRWIRSETMILHGGNKSNLKPMTSRGGCRGVNAFQTGPSTFCWHYFAVSFFLIFSRLIYRKTKTYRWWTSKILLTLIKIDGTKILLAWIHKKIELVNVCFFHLNQITNNVDIFWIFNYCTQRNLSKMSVVYCV